MLPLPVSRRGDLETGMPHHLLYGRLSATHPGRDRRLGIEGERHIFGCGGNSPLLVHYLRRFAHLGRYEGDDHAGVGEGIVFIHACPWVVGLFQQCARVCVLLD